MIIKSLRVQNFRAHDDFRVDFSDKTTLICGPKGSGKTSLLEAIFVLLRGTSFRSSDKEILKNDNNSSWFRIDIKTENDDVRTVKFDNSRVNGKKVFILDGKNSYRLANNKKAPVVLFEPDDLQLLSGSPNRRRRFLDQFLVQLYPSYANTHRKYEKALKQRNMLLKREKYSSDEIFPWNLMLADFGAEIISNRLELIERLNAKIAEVYAGISGVNDEIFISYIGEKMNSDKIMNELMKNEFRDKITGSTSVGPHRHDIDFIFNKTSAKNTASRGEVRSLILALKFLETDILAKLLDQKPIILLDDVFSELDERRQILLSKHFSQYQTIISSVNSIEDVDKIIEI